MKKSSNDLTRLELLYADELCLALHKDPGIPCQSKNTTSPVPLDISVEKYLNEPVRMWTRIDQPVSGLVLFYRNAFDQSKHRLSIVEKTYFAIVEGHPLTDGTITSKLRRDGRKRKAARDEHGKRADLTYTIVHHFDRYTLLRVSPTTGRFHQIRQQLAHVGFPVKGDVKYGARRKNHDRSIHLHAFQYTIQCGNADKISIFDYATPDDPLWNLSRPFIVDPQVDLSQTT